MKCDNLPEMKQDNIHKINRMCTPCRHETSQATSMVEDELESVVDTLKSAEREAST